VLVQGVCSGSAGAEGRARRKIVSKNILLLRRYTAYKEMEKAGENILNAQVRGGCGSVESQTVVAVYPIAKKYDEYETAA